MIKEFYLRKEIMRELLRLARGREVQAWFGDVRGMRPEIVNFEGDLRDLIEQGMTSFHVSEERWSDPLVLKPGLGKKDLDNFRVGWDAIIDIDSKNLEFSKICAELIIDALKFHDLKNYSLKFSVTGDTPVLIEDKNKIDLVPISKAVELYKQGEKLRILSLNLANKLEFSEITGSLVHDDEVYDVYYEQSGIPLKVTGHHSVFCWEKGFIIERKVSELKAGDYLISYNSAKDWNFSFENLKNVFTFGSNKYSSVIKNVKIRITKNLLRLIGYYLAEGHATKTNYMVGFTFNKGELDYIEDCKNLIKSLPGSPMHIMDAYPNSGSHQVIFHSKEWYTFFSQFCGVKKHKRIPLFVWKLPKDYILELLLAYIRGDAHKKSKRYLTIKSVSHMMACQFLWLCKLHDIPCNLYEEYNKPHKLPQGNLFSGSHVFMIKILRAGFPILEFNTQRHKFSKYPACKTFPVKPLREIYYKIKPGKFLRHRLERTILFKKRARLQNILKVISWFEKYNTKPIDHYSLKIIQNYKNLANEDICVLPIRKIVKEEGLYKVYDVSVDNTERFFGGCYPVLLHNSGNHGFHIGIPFEAFPKEVNNINIKDYFPDGVRVVSEYLKEMIKDFLSSRILSSYDIEDIAKNLGRETKDILADGKFNPFKVVDIDSVLISNRHLFRCVYSVNEKSGFVSIPLKKIDDFNIEDAKIENVKFDSSLRFLDSENVTAGEAKNLLIQAFDWANKNKIIIDEVKKHERIFEIPKVAIKSDYFPPCMLSLMSGVKDDGRKRAVFILANFLQSVGWSMEEVEKFLLEWNKRNREPLREGYIMSQISWFKRQKKTVLPPNCDNPGYYKTMGVKCEDGICSMCKNPVNYVFRRLKLAKQQKPYK